MANGILWSDCLLRIKLSKLLRFDEGKRILFESFCVLQRYKKQQPFYTVWTSSWTGLAYFTSISCFQFVSPGSQYLFCDTRSFTDVYYFTTLLLCQSFAYSFSRSFQSKIIGYVDIILTMRSARCICFYRFKQDQLRSTIFSSITNYIFSLLKAIYSVVFAFVCHHF